MQLPGSRPAPTWHIPLPVSVSVRRFSDLKQRHAHVSRELEALELSLTRAVRAAGTQARRLKCTVCCCVVLHRDRDAGKALIEKIESHENFHFSYYPYPPSHSPSHPIAQPPPSRQAPAAARLLQQKLQAS